MKLSVLKLLNVKFRSGTKGTSQESIAKEILQSSNAITPKATQKILVLDLDETLFHATQTVPAYSHDKVSVLFMGNSVPYSVAKRPGVDKFIQEVAKKFTLFVYTSSQKEYAHAMIEYLKLQDLVKEIYHRDHCLFSGRAFVKDLSIIRKNFKDLILLDDSEIHVGNHPFNALKIRPFKGEADDSELEKLLPLLLTLSEEEDVRPVGQKIRFLEKKLGIFEDQPENDDDDAEETQSASSIFNYKNVDEICENTNECIGKLKKSIVEENYGRDINETDESPNYNHMPVFDCSILETFNSKTPKSVNNFKSKLTVYLSPKPLISSSMKKNISFPQNVSI